MAYPVLNINPAFTFGRGSGYNILDSGQGIGRSSRRKVDDRKVLFYNLVFDKITPTEKDQLISLFEAPFQLNTPDDGLISVIIDGDTLVIEHQTNNIFSISLSVEQVLFTN